jgi:rhodanese-related sulfurtransferase
VVVNCAGGYRSSIASSLLKSHGFTDVSDLIGGYNAWADSNIPRTLPAIDVKAAQVYPNALLVDVREQDEWDAGHIDGSVHIPMAQLPDRLDELDKKAMTIVVCRSGQRSAKVAAWLINRDYDALNMTGGMLSWTEQGLPEVK